MEEKFSRRCLDFSIRVDGKLEKNHMQTPYILKYTALSRDLFLFFCNNGQQKGETMSPKQREEETCGDSSQNKMQQAASVSFYLLFFLALFLKANIMLTSDYLVKQK